MYPTQSEALDVLTDLEKVLRLPRDTGKDYKDMDFDLGAVCNWRA
jgi:hypothetical protein